MDTSSMIEAKKEYTTQLQQILSPRVYERFKFIFDGTLEVIKQELSMNQIQNQSVIKIFQKQLSSIKDWNESSIIEEYERIKNRSKCNYLDKLIKAVIIANMKILSTIQYGGRRKSKIQVHIPTPTHFIHKCYIECAKEIYKNPYIFDMSLNLSSKEKHQNLRDSLILIDNGIQSAIRQLLPIGDLLEQNFNSDVEDEEESESESESESVSAASESVASESESEEESTQSGGAEETVNDESSVSSASSASSLSSTSSSVSSLSSNSASSNGSSSISSGGSLASKVGSALESHTIEDIDIHIGDDKETQSILGGVVAERAEEANVQEFEPSPSPAPAPLPTPPSPPAPTQSGGSGTFFGALYNTFANVRNMNSNAQDVPAPVVAPKPMYGGGEEKPAEIREIVYSGNAVPKGFLQSSSPSTPPPPPPQVTPPVHQVPSQVHQVQQQQLFPLSQSIYPPQPQNGGGVTIIKKHRSGSSLSSSKKLSLKEQKYGKVQTSGSTSGLGSVRERTYSSGSEGSFHF